ncbi:hypothetical protein BST61_g9937 [Cercospora zeina]
MPTQAEFFATLKDTAKVDRTALAPKAPDSSEANDAEKATTSGASADGEAKTQDSPTCCPICTSSASVMVTTPCSHALCPSCAEAWFHRSRTCPMCRQELFSGEIAPLPWPPVWLPRDIVWLPVGDSEAERDIVRARAEIVGHNGDLLHDYLEAGEPTKITCGRYFETCEHWTLNVDEDDLIELSETLRLAVFVGVHWFKPRFRGHENASSNALVQDSEEQRIFAKGACSTAWKGLMESMLKTIDTFIDPRNGELWEVAARGGNALARLREMLRGNWEKAWKQQNARNDPTNQFGHRRPWYSEGYESKADKTQDGGQAAVGFRRVIGSLQFAQDVHDVVEYIVSEASEFFDHEEPHYSTGGDSDSDSDDGGEDGGEDEPDEPCDPGSESDLSI